MEYNEEEYTGDGDDNIKIKELMEENQMLKVKLREKNSGFNPKTTSQFILINPLKSSPKIGGKSKSLLNGSTKNKHKQNISLFKFEDKMHINKSPFADKKSTIKKIATNKNKSQRVFILIYK
jgi:hypothetical protein